MQKTLISKAFALCFIILPHFCFSQEVNTLKLLKPVWFYKYINDPTERIVIPTGQTIQYYPRQKARLWRQKARLCRIIACFKPISDV